MNKEWILEHKNRLILAAAGVVFIILLIIVASYATKKDDPLSGIKEDYSLEKEGSDITKLLTDYYSAYANDDMSTLEEIAIPIEDVEKSYISFVSSYVNSYDVQEIYSKGGSEKGSYLVSSYVLIHFNDLETPAPGLDFFFLRTNDEGNLYVDNIYSAFNLNFQVTELDPEVEDLITAFQYQEDFVALKNRFQKDYDELIEKDEAFKTFFETTWPQALVAWQTQYQEELAAAEAAAQAKAEEEAKAAEEAKKAAEEEAQRQAEDANATQVVAIDSVNVRQAADQGSPSLGKVEKGTVLTKYADEGEWSKIDYNGTRAFIKTEFLQAAGEQPAPAPEQAAQPAAGGYTAGTEVTLSDIVFIREKMDANSTKLGTVLTGDSVTVLENSDPSGWTKIKHRSKEGYIRTDILK